MPRCICVKDNKSLKNLAVGILKIKCEECNGCRYNKETLDIYYKGKNINDVLEMSIEEALTFFDAIPTIKSKLKTISEVGLSYIKLGQSATTFSGWQIMKTA